MAFNVNIEATQDISRALVDAFSPATQFLGSLGDRVRIYRQVSLLRSLKRAKEIAEAEGLPLTEPSPKFLVPYLEDCSLEDPDNTTLLEMWARLLVDASRESKSEHNLFIRILKELSAPEAHLFRFVASEAARKHPALKSTIDDAESFWRTEFLSVALRDSINRSGGLEGLSAEDRLLALEQDFRRNNEVAGSIVYYFEVAHGVPGHYPLDSVHDSGRGPIDDDFGDASIAVLKGLGLVGDFKSPEIWFGGYCFVVYAYYVTGLGAKFAKMCTDIGKVSDA